MVDIEELKPLIVEKLKSLNPEQIILFGSYAYGKPNEDSDVDLYVVTNDNFMPQSWKEKHIISQKVSQELKGICEKYPTDIITHTKTMHKKFVEMDSMFSRKILNEGIRLL